MSEADAETLEEFRDAFLTVSKGKPQVNAKDLATVMRYLGQCPTVADVLAFMKDCGAGGAPHVTVDQFVKTMADRMSFKVQQTDILESFEAFDREGHGMLTIPDLRHVLTSMGDHLDEDQAEEIIHQCSAVAAGSSGTINYRSFVKSMERP
eukprot:m51a1_g4134 hypothetical protein (151) ;mRNA; r:198733-199421